MEHNFTTDIDWEIIYYDLFDRSESVDKRGSDIRKGFYHLWYHSLLETVVEIDRCNKGRREKIPGTGFNFFTLIFTSDGRKRSIKVDVESHLEALLALKKLFFEGYEGFGLDDRKDSVIRLLSLCHCLAFFTAAETNFYEKIEEIASGRKVTLVSLKEMLMFFRESHLPAGQDVFLWAEAF